MSSSEIKDLIRLAGSMVRKEWVRTKDGQKENVQKIKDFCILPALNKLLFLCLDCVECEDHANFKYGLRILKNIYELSNIGGYGYNKIDEWVKVSHAQHLKAKDHLSWTVPSKETLERIYILASFIVKKGEYKYIKDICDLEIEKGHGRHFSSEKMLFHPNYIHSSGEGTLGSIFDEARELIIGNATLFENYFDAEHEHLVNYECRSDFLIEYYYFMNNIHKSGFPRVLNFTRFYFDRVRPLIEKMIQRPEEFVDLAPFDKEKFVDFIQYIISFTRKYLREYLSDWANKESLDEVKQMLFGAPNI